MAWASIFVGCMHYSLLLLEKPISVIFVKISAFAHVSWIEIWGCWDLMWYACDTWSVVEILNKLFLRRMVRLTFLWALWFTTLAPPKLFTRSWSFRLAWILSDLTCTPLVSEPHSFLIVWPGAFWHILILNIVLVLINLHRNDLGINAFIKLIETVIIIDKIVTLWSVIAMQICFLQYFLDSMVSLRLYHQRTWRMEMTVLNNVCNLNFSSELFFAELEELIKCEIKLRDKDTKLLLG